MSNTKNLRNSNYGGYEWYKSLFEENGPYYKFQAIIYSHLREIENIPKSEWKVRTISIQSREISFDFKQATKEIMSIYLKSRTIKQRFDVIIIEDILNNTLNLKNNVAPIQIFVIKLKGSSTNEISYDEINKLCNVIKNYLKNKRLGGQLFFVFLFSNQENVRKGISKMSVFPTV